MSPEDCDDGDYLLNDEGDDDFTMLDVEDKKVMLWLVEYGIAILVCLCCYCI